MLPSNIARVQKITSRPSSSFFRRRCRYYLDGVDVMAELGLFR